MNKWELARRDLLKTLGVGVGCLPLLKASRSWAQAEVAANRKFMVIHLTEGYRPNGWKPNTGPLTSLPDSMTPLEPHKDYLCVLPEMSNNAYKGGVRYGHESYGSIYWGGGVKGPKYKEPTGNTLDQVIADGIGKIAGGRTSVHFQVQLDRKPSQSQRGGNRCFWRDGNPLNPEANPATTYASLFAGVQTGGGATAGPSPEDMAAVKKTLGQKKSILDYVGRSLERFKTRLAREDRVMIEGHLRSVRELEGQLSTMVGPPAAGGGACTPVDPGQFTDDQIVQDDKLYPKITDAYMNMMLAAISCGLTKVSTLQVGDSTGNQINFGAFVDGIPARGTGYKSAFRNWHDLGHNPVLGGTDHKRIVDKWWMGKLNAFMGMMKATPDGPGGSLLDTSLLLWGNHMESGDSHHSQKVPWILAGKAGGKIKTGQAAASNGKDINAAMGDICRAMGVMPLSQWNSSIGGVTV